MTREQVWEAVAGYLRTEFGRILEVRDVRRVRKVAGEFWAVTVVFAAPSGDIHVADVNVDDQGMMTPSLDGDDLLSAIQRHLAKAKPQERSDDMGLAGLLDDLGGQDGDGDEMDLEGPEVLRQQIEDYLARGDETSLRRVRDLMPRLLADPDRRGPTLLRMASVEKKLGEPALAIGYLEAASREFGDRFDMTSLEKAAGMALELLGKEKFPGSIVHRLLEQNRARLRPLNSVFDCRSLAVVDGADRAWLEDNFTLWTLSPGEVLVNEGEASQRVFVIKSGLIAVLLEKPSGGLRVVRCCFPGWLLGESSVLVEGNPICTATLRAERITEVWAIDSAVLKMVMKRNKALADRIAATKQLHRIDSFFSMHETMGQLDVQVRDEMLGCIQRLQTFEEDTILVPAGDIPTVGCLVARGEIALFEGAQATPAVVVSDDGFAGLRDAIHQIPSPLTILARAGTTVAFFDGTRLRAMVERSPEQVAAVLERLG